MTEFLFRIFLFFYNDHSIPDTVIVNDRWTLFPPRAFSWITETHSTTSIIIFLLHSRIKSSVEEDEEEEENFWVVDAE